MVKVKRAFWCFLFLFLFSHAACDLLKPAQDLVAIRVGKYDITLEAFRRDLERVMTELGLNTNEIRPVFDLLVDRITERYLIMAYGKEHGISIEKAELNKAIMEIKADYPSEDAFNDMLLKRYVDFEIWKEQLMEQMLVDRIIEKAMEQVDTVTSQEIRYYYENNQELFRHPQVIKFRQIISKSAAEARSIIDILKKDMDFGEFMNNTPEQFGASTVIQERWASHDEMDEALADALFSLPVGLASSPLRTPYGYHVVEIMAKRPAGVMDLPEVMVRIEESLRSEKQEAFFAEWIETLKSRYPVRLDRDVLNKLEI